MFAPRVWATRVQVSTAGFVCPLPTPADPQAHRTPQPGVITVQTPAKQPTLCPRPSCEGTAGPDSMARNGARDHHPGPHPTVAGRAPPVRAAISSGEEGPQEWPQAWATSAPEEMGRGRASHSPCAPSLPSRLVGGGWPQAVLGAHPGTGRLCAPIARLARHTPHEPRQLTRSPVFRTAMRVCACR